MENFLCFKICIFFTTSEAIKASQSYADYRGKALEYYFDGYTQI